MEGRRLTGVWEAATRQWGPDQEKLDRALVGGLLLETLLLDVPDAAENAQSRLPALKPRLKHNLATYLAGRVTLDHFRTLVHNLDRWFPYYYPLVTPAVSATEDRRMAGGAPLRLGTPAPASPGVLREEELGGWLDRRVQGLLPHRPHSKFKADKLRDFLRRTRGGWFRVKEFQDHFQIDRKTAWEYLQKLLAAGLLAHNRGRSAAVRYCLAEQFLAVRARALRRKIPVILAELPPALTLEVADWLIATGREAFWEEPGRLPGRAVQGREILTRLLAALRVVAQTGGGRLLRLAPDWLRRADE
jgi:hypothetical protein